MALACFHKVDAAGLDQPIYGSRGGAEKNSGIVDAQHSRTAPAFSAPVLAGALNQDANAARQDGDSSAFRPLQHCDWARQTVTE
jgi:hypothetical protein